jgi:hypothetical protein
VSSPFDVTAQNSYVYSTGAEILTGSKAVHYVTLILHDEDTHTHTQAYFELIVKEKKKKEEAT